jgi:hypothetical protein
VVPDGYVRRAYSNMRKTVEIAGYPQGVYAYSIMLLVLLRRVVEAGMWRTCGMWMYF